MGSVGATRNTATSISKDVLFKTAQDYISHNMSVDTQSAKLDNAEIVSEIGEDGRANVRMEYTTTVRVVTGYDAETNSFEYDTEEEFHRDTFRIKVK